MNNPPLRPVISLVAFSMLAAGAGAATTSTTATPATSATTGSAEGLFEAFDPAKFNNSTEIANNWLPLRPGTKLVYEGLTVENGAENPLRIYPRRSQTQDLSQEGIRMT
jgi:hypothetical protein